MDQQIQVIKVSDIKNSIQIFRNDRILDFCIEKQVGGFNELSWVENALLI